MREQEYAVVASWHSDVLTMKNGWKKAGKEELDAATKHTASKTSQGPSWQGDCKALLGGVSPSRPPVESREGWKA
jgi:hypothetical protein